MRQAADTIPGLFDQPMQAIDTGRNKRKAVELRIYRCPACGIELPLKDFDVCGAGKEFDLIFCPDCNQALRLPGVG